MRVFLSYLIAVLTSATASSVFSTQFVVAGLQTVNVKIPFATRLSMTLTDLAILQTLIPIIAMCFLIGFLIAALGFKKIGGKRCIWYAISGACAVVSALLIMSFTLQLMPIAGARSHFGLFTQAIAGALGGFVFAHLSRTKI